MTIASPAAFAASGPSIATRSLSGTSQLSSLSADAIAHLVDGATVLFSNEYESALIEQRTPR